MPYEQSTRHKSGVIVYSIWELEKWLQEGRRLAEDDARFQLGEREAGHVMPHFTTDCPLCGWPKGAKGFVRAPALPGEWAYGKLFACPKCWPWPLGKLAEGSVPLTDGQQAQIEAARPRVGRVRR